GGASVAFAAGTVTASSSCTITVNVTAAAAGSYLNNTGAVTTANAGSSAGASATLTVLAHPAIAKAFAPSLVAPGAGSVLTITLSSPNSSAASGAAFTDNYPAGLVNTAAAGAATTCGAGVATAANNGTSVALAGVTIPPNGSCNVTVNVTSAAAGAYLNSTGA